MSLLLEEGGTEPVERECTNPETGFVHSWDLSTGVDGPGTRFVLFTAGCPLRCLYCHNPDTWRMSNGKKTGADDVLARIERYRSFLATAGGGVTISGGEPLLQPGFTGVILAGAHDMGLHTALDTSGALGGRADDRMLEKLDLVLLDVKAFDPARYRNLTRGSLSPTLRFAERLATLQKRTWIRYVLLPGWTDSPEHVRALADYLAGLGNIDRVDVLGYHRLGREKYERLGVADRLQGVPAATAEQVAAAQKIFVNAGLQVT